MLKICDVCDRTKWSRQFGQLSKATTPQARRSSDLSTIRWISPEYQDIKCNDCVPLQSLSVATVDEMNYRAKWGCGSRFGGAPRRVTVAELIMDILSRGIRLFSACTYINVFKILEPFSSPK